MQKNLTVIKFSLLALLAITVFTFVLYKNHKGSQPIMTANFIDLAKVEKISKYRSCQGHLVVPQNESESRRNMKHYVILKPEYQGGGKANVYSPINGIIKSIGKRPENGLEGEIWLGSDNDEWDVSIQHLFISEDLEEGQKVKAGQIIGMAADKGIDVVYGVGAQGTKTIEGYQSPYLALDSIFNHASKAILADYEAKGASLADLTYSKEFRDQNPCELEGTGGQLNDYEHPEDWTFLHESNVSWQFRDGKWNVSGNPPECHQPLTFPAPVDLSLVTGILYPGQIRGNDYKPHGGFRFDNNTNNEVDVYAPMDGNLFKAAQHLEYGEIQYSLYFINDCGIMYKLDHLREVTAKFKEILNNIPMGAEGDSRTTEIQPAVYVAKSEHVATKVGFENFPGGYNNRNVFVDFGVYDLRKTNGVQYDSAFQSKYPNINEYGTHAVCWFDYLSSEDEAIVRNLPADGSGGKVSDYCKYD